MSPSPLLRLVAGKMVVELQPRHHGKGAAIAGFMIGGDLDAACEPAFGLRSLALPTGVHFSRWYWALLPACGAVLAKIRCRP